MDKGPVIESGSHEQLLAAGNPCATSWRQQMRSKTPAAQEA
jgi:ABC-type multidrug transport system fused ATPase/permease subunit